MTSQPEEHSCKVTHNIENVMCHCRERNDILLAPEVAEVYIVSLYVLYNICLCNRILLCVNVAKHVRFMAHHVIGFVWQ